MYYIKITVTVYGKTFKGENFVVFHIANVFPRIMALLIGTVSLLACYHESFPANYNFPLYMHKLFLSNVLPYMVIR